MKKFCFFISMFLLMSFSTAATPNFDVYCSSAVLIDARTGNVLFEKNANQKSYPASTTKILTALITLQKEPDLQKEIVVSKKAVMSVPKGSSIAYFSANEKLTIEQVLYGLLLPSGNDAANILAEQISGSNQEFAVLMNETAHSLGAKDSNFTNPSGLHDDNHFTTASDIAKIAKEAMKYPKFREIVSQSRFVMPETNVSKSRSFLTTNNLLAGGEYFYEYATGIKTGYTSQAGNCLVSSATKDGAELICITLGGNNIPVGKSAVCIDSINLLNFGFENYYNKKLISQNEILTSVTPKKSGGKTLNLCADASINILVENLDTSTFDQKISLSKKISAPIKKGDVFGTVSYYKGNELIGISNLVASEDIEKEAWYWVVLKFLIYFVISVIILGILLRIFNEVRKKITRKVKR